jgi:16S rRNA (uracil1498-N3)-methyltransferase
LASTRRSLPIVTDVDDRAVIKGGGARLDQALLALAAAPEPPELVLVQALARGEKLDLVVQKATELGVHRIVPVSTERAVPRVEEERGEARLVRWRKIAREAARQSRRTDLPRIEPLTTFAAAVSAQPADALKLVFWEQARARHLRSIVAEHLGDAPVAPLPLPPTIVIAVGPEGGFSDEEVSIARASGFQVAGLGPRILRTETAAFTALAVIGYVFGDLG